jgi:hypothetical protein
MNLVMRTSGTAFDPRGTMFDTASGEPSWDDWLQHTLPAA